MNLEHRIKAVGSVLSEVATVLVASPNRLERNLAYMIGTWLSELEGFRQAVAEKAPAPAKLRVIEGGRRLRPPDQLEPEHAQ